MRRYLRLYQLDQPGLIPTGLVMAIEGKKGEPGKEWGEPSLESYNKLDPECEKNPFLAMSSAWDLAAFSNCRL